MSDMRKELERHIQECRNILEILENGALTDEQKIKIKQIFDLIRCKNNNALRSRDERRFVELISSIPAVAVQGYNRDREVIYWNKASQVIYGYSSSEALGKRLEDLIIPEEMREAVIAGITDWYMKGKVISEGELVLKRKDGRPVHVFSSHVMLGEGGDRPEMFCVDVDLSEISTLRDQNRDLKKKATKDTLTGVFNRYYLESIIKKRINESKLQQSPLSLIMLDIDFFKKINDNYGHDVGDGALVALVGIVQETIRNSDVLVRWGGEEFMILMPTDMDNACRLAEELRDCIEKKTRQHKDIPEFTCSLGVENVLAFPSFQAAYEAVDKKLYTAKNNGRNRVEF